MKLWQKCSAFNWKS